MERNNNIDLMKFFAIYCVVCIHTMPFKDIEQLSNLINVLSRFAVPFFFMSSGYLFGKKVRAEKESFAYMKRYSFKNFKLYAYWIGVYFVYDMCLKIYWAITEGVNIRHALAEYLKLFLNFKILYYGTETGSSHLWFLVALFWSIVIVYAFMRLNKISFLLIASLVLNIIGLFGQSYSVFMEFPIETRDTLFFGLFYTTLGYYLSLNQHKLKVNYNFLIGLLLFSVVMQIVEANLLINSLDARLGNYYLSTIPITFFLFTLVIKLNQVTKNNILERIGSRSVGIYVIHPIFISLGAIIVKLLHLENVTGGVIWNVIYTPLIFSVSYISYWIIQVVKSKLKSNWTLMKSNTEKTKLISQ